MYIYKTTCNINGIIYIGQCCKTPQKSKRYFGGGKLIELAIKKYGKENFTKEILKEGLNSQKDLDIWEMIFIKKFNSTDKTIGYNILPGTSNGFGHVNPATLPEVKIKFSILRKGKPTKPHTDEFKQAARERMLKYNPMKDMTGEKHFNFGKPAFNKLKKQKERSEKRSEVMKETTIIRNSDGTIKTWNRNGTT